MLKSTQTMIAFNSLTATRNGLCSIILLLTPYLPPARMHHVNHVRNHVQIMCLPMRGNPIILPRQLRARVEFESKIMSTSGTKISKRVEKELHQNKVIVRRLPPDITEERFRETITPFPDHTYFYLAPGDHTLGPLGCSRAYIAFEKEEEIVLFRDQYDGMILEGEKGSKYRAIVEFAPYQGIPKKRKPDYRCGTIGKDSDFQLFLQSLENRTEPRPSVNLETYLEELEASKIQDVQVTPLIEYLREKRSGRGRGRPDLKKKRKGGGETSSGKGKRSSKSADSGESSSTKGSRSRDSSSSKGKKEKRESESASSRTGSSTKLVAGNTQEGGGGGEEASNTSRSGSSHRSGAEGGRQEKKGRYRGGYDRKEGGGQEGGGGDTAGGEKESRKGRQRNRDRPDRSIYVPRSRDQGGGGGGGVEREGKERDSSSRDYHPGRSGGRGRQGRHDDSGDYGGRPRSRGRGRGYRSSRGSDQHYDSGYKEK